MEIWEGQSCRSHVLNSGCVTEIITSLGEKKVKDQVCGDYQWCVSNLVLKEVGVNLRVKKQKQNCKKNDGKQSEKELGVKEVPTD